MVTTTTIDAEETSLSVFGALDRLPNAATTTQTTRISRTRRTSMAVAVAVNNTTLNFFHLIHAAAKHFIKFGR